MDAVAAFDLTKEYEGRTALTGLNLQVPQGEAFACVGERACGKTMLIRLLCGLARPTSGECTVLGLSRRMSLSACTAWREPCWTAPSFTQA